MKRAFGYRLAVIFALGLVLCAAGAAVWAQTPAPAAPVPANPSQPSFSFAFTPGFGQGSQPIATGIQLVALLTVLSVAPAILMMMTSFVRIIVVLGFVRRALGTQTVPPTQVLIGLAMFLTFFVMAPTFGTINDNALKPFMNEQIDMREAVRRAEPPMREFLLGHTRKTDLQLFINISKTPQPQTKDDVPNYVLIPAFMVSELHTSFLIGFIIYIPFLIIDMVVGAILLSMGMMMLPPQIVSLPFKIILFVLVDGWTLIIGSLARSITG